MELEKPISQKIWKTVKSRNGKTTFNKKPIGVLVAGIDPESKKLVIGYSLCHKNDHFNRHPGTGKLDKNFARNMATARAVRNLNNNEFTVPESIKNNMTQFLSRCAKYYKDQLLPYWTNTHQL